MTTQRTYNPTDGTVPQIKAGTNASYTDVQNQVFEWDLAGNLLRRKDNRLGTDETFTYDALYRLKTTSKTVGGGSPVVKNHDYDAVGNLKALGDAVTGYQYQAGKAHAVSQVSKSGTVESYTYDNNGNLATVAVGGSVTKAVCWSTSNHPTLIAGGAVDCGAGTTSAAVYSQFKYDPSRARYKQERRDAQGAAETTIYVGSLYERVTKSGQVQHRHYIRAGGRVIALYTRLGDGTGATEYWHRDHLDSIVVRTDEAGAVIADSRVRYDAWGQRESGTGDKRGYTGHEMLEDLGLIHMNGRVYDSTIGKFLSADPFIQFPESTQGFNRYAYVGNNPLSYTDPSGHFSLKQLIRPIAAIALAYITYGAVSGYLTTAIGNAAGVCYASTYTPTLAAIGGGVAGGAVGGGVATGTWEGAAHGAISGAVFGGIGAHYGNRWTLGRVVSNSIAGGATSEMAGGDFQDGFRSQLFQLGLKFAMDSYSGYESTLEPAETDAVVKPIGAGVQDQSASNTGTSIVAPEDSGLVGAKLSALDQGQLKALKAYNRDAIVLANNGRLEFSWRSEGSPYMNSVSRHIPGVNAFSVFHDVWMTKWGVSNAAFLALTIPVAAAAQYCALGACFQQQIAKEYDQ